MKIEPGASAHSIETRFSLSGADATVPLTTTGTEAQQQSTELQLAKSGEEINAAIRVIDDAVKASNISLKFSRDEDTGSIVIELIDQNTGEPVRQIPSEAALRLAAALGKLQGNIVNRLV
jgi:flagellar protein FlaG